MAAAVMDGERAAVEEADVGWVEVGALADPESST